MRWSGSSTLLFVPEHQIMSSKNSASRLVSSGCRLMLSQPSKRGNMLKKSVVSNRRTWQRISLPWSRREDEAEPGPTGCRAGRIAQIRLKV
jgi:hypothetical protein